MKIWMILTIILAIVLVAVLIIFYGGQSGTALLGGLSSTKTSSATYASTNDALFAMERTGLAKLKTVIIVFEDGTTRTVTISAPQTGSEKISAVKAITQPIKIVKYIFIDDDGSIQVLNVE